MCPSFKSDVYPLQELNLWKTFTPYLHLLKFLADVNSSWGVPLLRCNQVYLTAHNDCTYMLLSAWVLSTFHTFPRRITWITSQIQAVWDAWGRQVSGVINMAFLSAGFFHTESGRIARRIGKRDSTSSPKAVGDISCIMAR